MTLFDASREPGTAPGAINATSQGLVAAFDVARFRRDAELALTQLEEYLTDSSLRGLELRRPDELRQRALELAHWDEPPTPAQRRERLRKILDLYIETGIQVHSPGYMGRQFSGVIPLSSVVDFVSSTVNQPSSFYEAGQLPNVVERIMADEFNRLIGWPKSSFHMVTTSGGSLANLTAILAARNRRFPTIWKSGTASGVGDCRPAVAVSAECHYSIQRALGILGIGQEQVVCLPTNDQGQIRTSRVRSTLRQARQQGFDVFCLVASAGTTALGAFDDLDALGEITQSEGIWFHVDGAHGASLLVSRELQSRLNGIQKADSLTWDAHKLMFVPAPCTLLFYRDGSLGKGAFSQHASYVFDEEEDVYSSLDSAAYNFECTKRPMIMNLWTCWVLHGREVFAQKIEYLCRLTQLACDEVERVEDFERVHSPQSNILCFRYLPRKLRTEEVGGLQLRIRSVIRLKGKFFISKVDVQGIPALRVVFMNHEIQLQHFRLLLQEIRAVGQQLLREARPAVVPPMGAL